MSLIEPLHVEEASLCPPELGEPLAQPRTTVDHDDPNHPERIPKNFMVAFGALLIAAGVILADGFNNLRKEGANSTAQAQMVQPVEKD